MQRSRRLRHAIVLVDAAVLDNNGGPALAGGCGWSIIDALDREEVRYGRMHLYNLSSMMAEYRAVVQGIIAARKAGYGHITVRSDCESVVKDINGVIDLGPGYSLSRSALRNAAGSCQVIVEQVDASEVRRAHKLAGQAARQEEPMPERYLSGPSVQTSIKALNNLREDTRRLKSALEHRIRYGDQEEIIEASGILSEFTALFDSHINDIRDILGERSGEKPGDIVE